MRRVLFIGGGHSHVLALLRLSRRRLPNMSIKLISDSDEAPYSGMLPGFVGGQFTRRECLINLPSLCSHVGAEWQRATAVSADTAAARIQLQDGGDEPYDVLSINVGGAPGVPFSAPGAATKPVMSFMDWLESMPGAPSLAVVGAGAGGVETALAFRRRFVESDIALIGASLLPGFAVRTRQKIRELMKSRNIQFHESTADSFDNGGVVLANGERAAATHVVFATPVCAPEWLQNTGLMLDGNGFIRVNSFLQSESAAGVFAAGDCANSGAPKSGAVAVRQAPVLADNIAAFVSGTPLSPWRTRRKLLAILNTADGRAIADWGGFSASGAWTWTWKKYLDEKFMSRFPSA